MDRLEELATFVAIVEGGSLIAASRRLQKSPPAVTRALSGLEDRMGLRLVERTTRRLSPTEGGIALIERARSLLADYEQLLAGATQARLQGRAAYHGAGAVWPPPCGTDRIGIPQ